MQAFHLIAYVVIRRACHLLCKAWMGSAFILSIFPSGVLPKLKLTRCSVSQFHLSVSLSDTFKKAVQSPTSVVGRKGFMHVKSTWEEVFKGANSRVSVVWESKQSAELCRCPTGLQQELSVQSITEMWNSCRVSTNLHTLLYQKALAWKVPSFCFQNTTWDNYLREDTWEESSWCCPLETSHPWRVAGLQSGSASIQRILPKAGKPQPVTSLLPWEGMLSGWDTLWGFAERKLWAPLLQRSALCRDAEGAISSAQGQPCETPWRTRASDHSSWGQGLLVFFLFLQGFLQKHPLKKQGNCPSESAHGKCPLVRSHLFKWVLESLLGSQFRGDLYSLPFCCCFIFIARENICESYHSFWNLLSC